MCAISPIIFILISVLLSSGRAQRTYCSKIDFNRPEVSGFRECTDRFLPMFHVKRYRDTPDVPPYRPTSEYYISNHIEGFSCTESEANFYLNKNSYIMAAIYLHFATPGASIQVNVVDADTRRTVYRWKSETSNGWFLLNKAISGSIKNAKIELHANSNKGSRLAIEYLHVLNSAIAFDECVQSPEPTAPPTEETEPTDSNNSTEPIATTEPTGSETIPTPTVAPSAEAQSDDNVWRIVGIVIVCICLIACLMVVIFLIVRHRRRKLLDVAPVQANDESSYGTLPRLHVVGDKISGVTMGGGGVSSRNDIRSSHSNYPN